MRLGYGMVVAGAFVQREAGTDVYVLRLASTPIKGQYENQFDSQVVAAINACLDQVLAACPSGEPCALVITSGAPPGADGKPPPSGPGKFFSNGHNLEFLSTGSPEAVGRFLRSFYLLVARLLTFPCPIVACINGHAFAGGFLLATACDYRVMRADRGFACMNEIDMVATAPAAGEATGRPAPGSFAHADMLLNTVLSCKFVPLVLRDMLLQGKRYDGAEALRCGLADAIADGAGVERAAVELAQTWAGKGANRRTYGILKSELHRGAVAVLSGFAAKEGEPAAGAHAAPAAASKL